MSAAGARTADTTVASAAMAWIQVHQEPVVATLVDRVVRERDGTRLLRCSGCIGEFCSWTAVGPNASQRITACSRSGQTEIAPGEAPPNLRNRVSVRAKPVMWDSRPAHGYVHTGARGPNVLRVVRPKSYAPYQSDGPSRTDHLVRTSDQTKFRPLDSGQKMALLKIVH